MPKDRTKTRSSESNPKPTRLAEQPDGFGLLLYYSLAKHLLLAGFILLLFSLRKPDTLLVPQLFAEDICVFFSGQYRLGLRSLLEPSSGYLHTIPRLVALAAGPLPVVHQPLLYNTLMLLIQAAATATFFHPAYRWLIRSDALRFVMCIVTALAFPSAEMIGTISNAHWHLLPVALLFLFHQPGEEGSSRRFFLIRAGLLVIIGLSAPVLAIALPLSLWRCFRAPGKERIIALIFSATACIQLGVYLSHPQTDAALKSGATLSQITFGSIVAVFYRVVLSDCFGEPVARAINSHASHRMILILLIAIAGWLVWLFVALRSRRFQILSLLYLAVASIVTTLVGRDLMGWFQSLGGIGLFAAERYFFLSSCILVLLIGFTVERVFSARRQLTQSALLLLLFAGGIYANFHVPAFPDLQWNTNAAKIENVMLKARNAASAESLYLPVLPVPRHCMVP